MKKQTKLNLKQEEFCRLYVTKGETYGKGYLCHMYAYGKDIPLKEDGTYDNYSKEYAVCQVSGSRLLTEPLIQNEIRRLLLERFDDDNADARISSIIQNGEDRDAIQAVKVYNDLKGRVIKKLDVTSGNRPLSGFTDEELRKLAGE